jgi:uncharacterized protein YbaR (Trm112 family)
MAPPTCPICGGDGCLPQDNNKGHRWQTAPCPIVIGCNGAGFVSDFKYQKIMGLVVKGRVWCAECENWHPIKCTIKGEIVDYEIEEEAKNETNEKVHRP